MKIKLASAILSIFVFAACSTPKDIVYLQGVDSLTPEQIDSMSQTYTTKIKPDDLLNITVTASDPSVVTPFNPPVFAYAQQGEEPLKVAESMYNYLVDSEGFINFPVLGKIEVAGLSKRELSDKLQNSISKYIENPLVNIQIANFKVIIMGEISRPGSYTVRNDRYSILDLVGQAGDLPITANRKNLLIIRDNRGKKEFARFDLTSPDIFSSPYFYLQQNDVVYVEPNEAKQKNSKYSQAKQYNISVFSSIISSVSIITSMVISLVSLSKSK